MGAAETEEEDGTGNLTVEVNVLEEEASENLGIIIGVEVEGGSDEGERGEGGLKSTGILTQDAEPGGTTLVDARNGFNDMSRLEMLWTVRHLWPGGGQGLVSISISIGRSSSYAIQ